MEENLDVATDSLVSYGADEIAGVLLVMRKELANEQAEFKHFLSQNREFAIALYQGICELGMETREDSITPSHYLSLMGEIPEDNQNELLQFTLSIPNDVVNSFNDEARGMIMEVRDKHSKVSKGEMV